MLHSTAEKKDKAVWAIIVWLCRAFIGFCDICRFPVAPIWWRKDFSFSLQFINFGIIMQTNIFKCKLGI